MSRYSHALRDRTATALTDFATGLLRMSALLPGMSCNIVLSYDDAPSYTDLREVVLYVERDDNGIYFFNETEIGDLEQATMIYSLACAELMKTIATDEWREDHFEELSLAALPKSSDDNTEISLESLDELTNLLNEEDSDNSDGDELEIIEYYKPEI